MSDKLHERARELVFTSLVEDLREPDRLWVQAHLASCAGCEAFQRALRDGLAALRLPDVVADPALVAATQQRLTARARALGEAEAHLRPLVASCALGAMVSVATACSLWQGLRSLGDHLGAPAPVALAAALLLWFLPASAAALFAIVMKPRRPPPVAVASMEVR